MQQDFKRPKGVSEQDMDANAEGEVMAVMDLRADEGLRDAGLAREVVNRVQKLRKKAGLQVRPVLGARHHSALLVHPSNISLDVQHCC